MKLGSLHLLLAALLLTAACAGCGSTQPSHSGIYVARIWTVPELVTTSNLVELHMDESFDLPPGVTILPSAEPVQWTVSAGELFPWEVDLATYRDERLDKREFQAGERVMWRAPSGPQDVQVTAQRYGQPLTVTIKVVGLVYSIYVTDPEIHVNETAMFMLKSHPRDGAIIKEAALEPPIYAWRVSAGELFAWYPQHDQSGGSWLQSGSWAWWRAPAVPQTVTVEYFRYSSPISTEIEVLPAP